MVMESQTYFLLAQWDKHGWFPVIFLRARFSDTAGGLNWSNGHGTVTPLSDTGTSCCCAEYCLFALGPASDRLLYLKSMWLFMVVRQIPVFREDLLMPASSSAGSERVCFHFSINQLHPVPPSVNDYFLFAHLSPVAVTGCKCLCPEECLLTRGSEWVRVGDTSVSVPAGNEGCHQFCSAS